MNGILYIWDASEQKYVPVPALQGLPGKDGLNGTNGKDGYTPIKGVDYYTETDKAEIVDDVVVEITDITDEQADLIAQVEETLAGKSLPAASSDSGVFAYMEKGPCVESGWNWALQAIHVETFHYMTRISLVGLENYIGKNITLHFLRRMRKKGWGNLMTFYDIRNNKKPAYKFYPDYLPKTVEPIVITDQNIEDGYIDVDLYSYLVPCLKPLSGNINDVLYFQTEQLTYGGTRNHSLVDDNLDLIGRYRSRRTPRSCLKISCVIENDGVVIGHCRNSVSLYPQYNLDLNEEKLSLGVDEAFENLYICGMTSIYN